MKKLHIFTLKSFAGPLILTFFVTMFVLLMQFLWKYVDDLAGKGLSFSVISELLFYASAGLVQMALPLAVLLASLMTFGNMGENYELTAVKASGISLLRLMYPLIILTVLISVGAFLFSNYVLPYTNLKAGSLLWDIKNKRPELSLKEGSFNNDLQDYTIKIGRKNMKTQMMYNFMIYDHTNDKGNSMVNVADSAQMYMTADGKFMVLTLYSGYGYEEIVRNELSYNNGNQTDKSYKPARRNKFSEQRVIVDISANQLKRTDKEMFKHNSQMMSLKKLSSTSDSLLTAFQFTQNTFYDYIRGNFSKDFISINIPDSVKKKIYKEKVDSKVYFNIDSAYNKLGLDQQLQTLRSALNQASSAHAYIKDSKSDFKSRYRFYALYNVEWHLKFTMSLACFIFFLIGAPLGAIIRKGGLGVPVIISITFFILYYMISLVGKKFVREAYIPSNIGIWFSTMILLPLSIFLTYKAIRDSSLMNSSVYSEWIIKMFKKLANKRVISFIEIFLK